MGIVFLMLLSLLGAHDMTTVEVHFTEQPPKIDGVIEEVWQQADSAYDFVQHTPYERSMPTEKTVVYVLQDRENLYFGFRCYAQNRKPVAKSVGDEDYVIVKIDPFGNKTTGYYFWVSASAQMWDGWLHDDGRITDDSWEGIWYRGIRLHDDYYEVEIKIPFKAIRYKAGLNQWGVQFMRHIPSIPEDDLWTEVLQVESDLISKWGSLDNVDPHVSGYHFELYPEVYARHHRHFVSDTAYFKPSASLNLKWDMTSQATINGTVFPDFAQIESDPFTLNLDQYPVYLEERRPFFLEGADIFRLSDFGSGAAFFQPLKIFYSRRIGKSMDGDAIPIVAGLKLANKSTDWNLAGLGVRTSDFSENNVIIERARWFGALRAKRRVFENSDLDFLLSGTMIDKDYYNYAVGIGGVFRRGANQLIVQGAVSDKDGTSGWAMSSGFVGNVGPIRILSAVEALNDSFDVSDIGYVPWSGRRKANLYAGPYIRFASGLARMLYVASGMKMVREPGQDDWSKLCVLLLNPTFRNNMYLNLQFLVGPYYEADTNYLRKEMLFSMGGNVFDYWLAISSYFGYMYNYRQNYLAYRGSVSLSYNISITSLINPGITTNMWIEWDTLGSIAAVTSQLRPNIVFFINADTKVELFSELVLNTQGADLTGSQLSSNRFGLLFSWRFHPKSWLYIALNDYRAQEEHAVLQPQYRIGAIKAKYLLYF